MDSMSQSLRPSICWVWGDQGECDCACMPKFLIDGTIMFDVGCGVPLGGFAGLATMHSLAPANLVAAAADAMQCKPRTRWWTPLGQ